MRKLSKSEKIIFWIVGVLTFIAITGNSFGMIRQSCSVAFLIGYLIDLSVGIAINLFVVMFIFWIVRKVKKKDKKSEIK